MNNPIEGSQREDEIGCAGISNKAWQGDPVYCCGSFIDSEKYIGSPEMLYDNADRASAKCLSFSFLDFACHIDVED